MRAKSAGREVSVKANAGADDPAAGRADDDNVATKNVMLPPALMGRTIRVA